MIHCLTLVLVGGFAVACHGAEQQVLPGTLSPDKKVAILEETNDSGRDYYFVQMPGEKKIGLVLPADQRGQISNVNIVASWNADSTKLALLVFYGTKLSELLLASKDASGQFQPIELHEPDAAAIYKQRTRHPIPESGDGSSDNAVGPWLDKDTVCLISGESKQAGGSSDHYNHFYVTFKARVRGRRSTVSDVRLKGPLTDEASEQFEKKWGTRYFEGGGD